jgi:uncharacterized protein (DUF1810 family)
VTLDPDRFVAAQDRVWPAVLAELCAGRKASHWMWFVFPQLAGLGASATSVHYALASGPDARSYLAHPVLGPRLREATGLVLAHAGLPPEAIFGATDALKFQAAMTLFAAAAPGDPLFAGALDAFFGGRPHARTLDLLGAAPQ